MIMKLRMLKLFSENFSDLAINRISNIPRMYSQKSTFVKDKLGSSVLNASKLMSY